MIAFLTLLLGLVLLIGGGGMLVRGASDIATRFGVSPLLVGLTIVGFGTSAPELVVNILSASRGATDLAFGNVIGSNISNMALILGTAAIIMPIKIQGQLVRREIPLLLLATTIMTVMALDGKIEGLEPYVGRTDSVVLLLLFAIFLYTMVLDLFVVQQQDALLTNLQDYPLLGTDLTMRFGWLLALGGLALLFVGGKLTVDGAVAMAEIFAVPANIVGLFVVAIGTSMPELVTSIIAAVRNESDLAVGNVVGSSLFNSLVVLPVTGLVQPVPVPEGGIADLLVSWGFVALLIPVFFLGQARLSRGFGVVLFLAYVAYVVVRVGGVAN
mgnify:FL=1